METYRYPLAQDYYLETLFQNAQSSVRLCSNYRKQFCKIVVDKNPLSFSCALVLFFRFKKYYAVNTSTLCSTPAILHSQIKFLWRSVASLVLSYNSFVRFLHYLEFGSKSKKAVMFRNVFLGLPKTIWNFNDEKFCLGFGMGF